METKIEINSVDQLFVVFFSQIFLLVDSLTLDNVNTDGPVMEHNDKKIENFPAIHLLLDVEEKILWQDVGD